jgi:hypothetical protein
MQEILSRSVLPYSRLFVNTGEPIESENCMEFRLLYEGELLSTGNRNTRPEHKHQIRKQFHPQLRRLWMVSPNLRQLATIEAPPMAVPVPDETTEARVQRGIRARGQRWTRARGFEFVPLVTDDYAVRCSLDILLLRPEEQRFLFTQGDIDGHIKTIFDALQVPPNADHLGDSNPADDEVPFHCLLSDDKLISEVHLKADQLLLLPRNKILRPNDSFAVIHVKLNHRHAGSYDRWFE